MQDFHVVSFGFPVHAHVKTSISISQVEFAPLRAVQTPVISPLTSAVTTPAPAVKTPALTVKTPALTRKF